MADTQEYRELRQKVLAWSNRDNEVLNLRADSSDQATDPDVLDDFLEYAADKAYRTLRVPALEKTYVYTITESNTDLIENNCLQIPSDLTEFISISKSEGLGVTANCPIVYNQKTDYRTFRDSLAVRTNELYWARFGGQILLSPLPGVNAGDVFELYYYGRPTGGLDATYDPDTVIGTDPETGDPVTIGTNEDGSRITIPNWMRDENERVLLFGALAEAFAYLGEDDMMQKYTAMFMKEIEELNKEDNMRQGSGGNVQTQYISYLI